MPSIPRLTRTLARAAVSLIAAGSASAADLRPEIAIETDPATFAFSGYAAHLRLRLPGQETLRPWTLGVGVYGMAFPTLFRDIALSDAPSDAKLTLSHGVGVFVDRFLGAPDRGWFAGVQVADQRYAVSDAGPSAHYSALLVMPRIGYHWELGHGFYALPWMGIGHLTEHDGDAADANAAYAVRHWLPFATLHLGYRF